MPLPFPRAAARGAALLTALLVVVVITVLVMGAITLTSSERNAAVQHSSTDRVTACKLAARNRLLSQIRVLKGNVLTIAFDEPLDNKPPDHPEHLRVRTGHLDVTADVDDIKVLDEEAGLASRIEGVTNRFGIASGGGGSIDSTPYRVSVICTERNGNQHEVEFVVRVGI